MTPRIVKHISVALIAIGGILGCTGLVLGILCMTSGVLSPDLRQGLTYPVNMHGTLYVQPSIGIAYQYVGGAAIIGIFIGAGMYLLWDKVLRED